MDYLYAVMFWSGVVLWVVCILAWLMVFGESIGLSIPSICRGKSYTIYRFGVGEFAILRDDEMVDSMKAIGYNIRGKQGRWWMVKILRWQP